MFKKKRNAIRDGVMQVIEDRLNLAQEEFEVDQNEMFIAFEMSRKKLEEQHETNHRNLIERHVSKVVGKLI